MPPQPWVQLCPVFGPNRPHLPQHVPCLEPRSPHVCHRPRAAPTVPTTHHPQRHRGAPHHPPSHPCSHRDPAAPIGAEPPPPFRPAITAALCHRHRWRAIRAGVTAEQIPPDKQAGRGPGFGHPCVGTAASPCGCGVWVMLRGISPSPSRAAHPTLLLTSHTPISRTAPNAAEKTTPPGCSLRKQSVSVCA